MNKVLAKRMANLLRLAHQRYMKNPNSLTFQSGICFAMGAMATKDSYRCFTSSEEYRAVSDILVECQQGYIPSSFLRCLDGQWVDGWVDGSRSMMCLFMAEWIETEILGKE